MTLKTPYRREILRLFEWEHPTFVKSLRIAPHPPPPSPTWGEGEPD